MRFKEIDRLVDYFAVVGLPDCVDGAPPKPFPKSMFCRAANEGISYVWPMMAVTMLCIIRVCMTFIAPPMPRRTVIVRHAVSCVCLSLSADAGGAAVYMADVVQHWPRKPYKDTPLPPNLGLVRGPGSKGSR